MGDRAATIWSGFWSDADVEAWPINKRYLFLFLWSNELCSTSGVYYITRRRIHKVTDLPLPELDQYLIHDGIKNVSYDARNNVVFIHNKLRYMRGGRPDLIAKSIIGDYWANPDARQIWREFREKYRATIMANNILHNHFFSEIDLDTADSPLPLLLGSTPLTPNVGENETEIEAKIQRQLNRYAQGLPPDDVERIMIAYEHLTKNKTTGRPTAAKSRLTLLELWAKEPIEVIARAAYLFITSGAIGDNRGSQAYYHGIMRKGARAWFTEYDRERKKRQEDSLGDR